jgi:hypothetical protein
MDLSLGGLALLFAGMAAHRERQRAEPSFGDLALAVDTRSVATGVASGRVMV